MRRLLRDPLSWAVTAFMGLQSLTYYASVTWNATLLRDAGTSAHHAGVLLAFGVLAALGPLAVGVLYTATRGWGVPIGLLIVLLVAQFAAGAVASRNRLILGRRPAPDAVRR